MNKILKGLWTGVCDQYFKLHGWLVIPAAGPQAVEVFRIHVLLGIVLITGFLMWGYAFAACLFIDESSLCLGFLYAIVHISSLYAFKKTRSFILATYLMLVPGGIFQTHYAYFSGGVQSATIVWVSILPLIAGVLIGPFHAMVWWAVSSLFVTFIFLTQETYLTLGRISPTGEIISRIFVLYGMITMAAGFTIFLIKIALKNEDTLKLKTLEKQGLLRILVHDIANPIMIIRSRATSVEEDLAEPQLAKENILTGIAGVHKQLDRIERQITLVRELEAVSSGKAKIERNQVQLLIVINRALESVATAVTRKKLEIAVQVSADQKIWVNEALFENQILGNILSNAVKFSNLGGKLNISAQELGGSVRVLLQDFGMGIATEDIATLFDPLVPTTHKGTMGEMGTGFGMPIVKTAVEALSGTIEVSSTLGQGTTVILHFPVNAQALKSKKKIQNFYLSG